MQSTPALHSQHALSTEELVNGSGVAFETPSQPLFTSAEDPAVLASAEDPAVQFGSSIAEQLAARQMAQQKRRALARHPPLQRIAAEDSDSDKEGRGEKGRKGAAKGWREGYIDAIVRSRAISPDSPTRSRGRHDLPSEVPWHASEEHREGGFRADPRYETGTHRHPPPPWENAGRQHSEAGGARRDGGLAPPWERAEGGAPTGGWETRAPPWEQQAKDARGGGRMRGGKGWLEESPPRAQLNGGGAAGYARRYTEEGLASALDRDGPGGGGAWAGRSGWGGRAAGRGGEREGGVDRWMALEEEDRAVALLNMTGLSRSAVRRCLLSVNLQCLCMRRNCTEFVPFHGIVQTQYNGSIPKFRSMRPNRDKLVKHFFQSRSPLQFSLSKNYCNTLASF